MCSTKPLVTIYQTIRCHTIVITVRISDLIKVVMPWGRVSYLGQCWTSSCACMPICLCVGCSVLASDALWLVDSYWPEDGGTRTLRNIDNTYNARLHAVVTQKTVMYIFSTAKTSKCPLLVNVFMCEGYLCGLFSCALPCVHIDVSRVDIAWILIRPHMDVASFCDKVTVFRAM
jgi:hypothetical protein